MKGDWKHKWEAIDIPYTATTGKYYRCTICGQTYGVFRPSGKIKTSDWIKWMSVCQIETAKAIHES